MTFKFFVILSLLIALSGCSTIVADYISEAKSYPVDQAEVKIMMEQYAYTKHQYCDSESGNCISYFKTSGDKQSEELVENHEVDFGQGNENINLKVSRASFPEFTGTVILLHGYRGSKEWMSITGGYFRFLGFDVLMPDLPGHGESDGEISFGVLDTGILLRWLQATLPENEPLIILGNSMGAVSAVNMSTELPNLRGLILQAPMRRFDDAVTDYANFRGPWLTQLIPDDSFREGAVKALRQKSLTVADTDIKLVIKTLTIPVLIFASDSDPIAPYHHFDRWRFPGTTLHLVKGRSHPAMALINQSEHVSILEFLTLLYQFN